MSISAPPAPLLLPDPAALDDADLPLPCPNCGYDLRATTADRCPECGSAIDDEVRSGEATIPWQHRRRVGRVRAFFLTLRWALFRPNRLAQQAGRRVEHRSARIFQLICCLIGGLALGAILTPDLWLLRKQFIGYPPPGVVIGWHPAFQPPTLAEAAGDVAILAAFWLAMPLWLFLGSGVPSYFFHPPRLPRVLQDRGVAISYYAAAPLVLLAPATAAVAWAAYVWRWLGGYDNTDQLLQAIWWGIAAVLVLWGIRGVLWLPVQLLMHGQHAAASRAMAMLATLCLTWPLLLIVTLLLLPGLVFYVQFLWLLLT